MKEYYLLNKNKVWIITKLYLMAFGALSAASVSVLVYFYDFDLTKGILFGLAATIILTAFLVLQAIVTGNYQFQRRKRIFGIPVLRSFFRDNEFALIPILTESRWELTEEAMTGRIHGFVVEADIDEESPQLLFFKFKTQRIALNKDRFNQVMNMLKNYNATLTSDGVSIGLEFARLKTVEELRYRLDTFSESLISEGFTPN